MQPSLLATKLGFADIRDLCKKKIRLYHLFIYLRIVAVTCSTICQIVTDLISLTPFYETIKQRIYLPFKDNLSLSTIHLSDTSIRETVMMLCS